MKNRTKKIAASIALTSMLMTTTPANATGIPTVDIGAIAESIASNIQAAYQWAEEKMISLSQIDMEALMSKFEIDALNNAIANMIVRINNTTQDVHNAKIIEMTTPDRDVCKNIAINLVMDDIYCALDSQREEQAAASAAARQANVAASTSGAEHDKYVSKKVKEYAESCAGLPSGQSVKSMNDTHCARIENLTQGPADTDSQEVKERTRLASELIIDNMTNEHRPRKATNPNLPESIGKKTAIAADLRFEAFKEIVRDSLHETNNMRQVPQGTLKSPMQALIDFDMKHWGDELWIQEVSNTGPTKISKPVSQTELMRKLAVMEAFNTHLSLLHYQSQLRLERLSASQLELQLDPMKKTD